MYQVYLLQGSGTKMVNLTDQKNVRYLLVDLGFCPVGVIQTNKIISLSYCFILMGTHMLRFRRITIQL